MEFNISKDLNWLSMSSQVNYACNPKYSFTKIVQCSVTINMSCCVCFTVLPRKKPIVNENESAMYNLGFEMKTNRERKLSPIYR